MGVHNENQHGRHDDYQCEMKIRYRIIFDGFKKLIHFHKFETTFINVFGIDIEQRCRFGTYRHTLFEDLNLRTNSNLWRDGKHPCLPRKFFLNKEP